MNVGLDTSAVVYGTGVSNYTLELMNGLRLKLGSSLKTFSFSRYPLMFMEYLWNGLHVFDVENLIGKIDIYHSSDWVQAPSKAKKVTTVHDLTPFLYPAEVDPLIVEVHTRRMKWVEKECDSVICVSQSTASDLKKLFKISDEKIHVIYEGLPTKFAIKPNQKINDKYIF